MINLLGFLPFPLQTLAVTMFFISIGMLMYVVFFDQVVTVKITVNKLMFARLQQIYEFRKDMLDNIILNSPVLSEENLIKGILLTVTKKRKDINALKKCISLIQSNIDKENSTIDKYL